MAYSKFLKSDMYIIKGDGTFLSCVVCRLKEDNIDQMSSGFFAYSTQEMIDHIERHREYGHKFADDLIDKLLADDSKNFPHKPNTTQPPTPSSLE